MRLMLRGEMLLLRLFFQKNEVEDEVFIDEPRRYSCGKKLG